MGFEGGVRTTHVGSLPRPPNLSPQNLDRAIEEVVKMQVEIGLDEVNDGEYRRQSFISDLTELPGFEVTELTGRIRLATGGLYQLY